MDLNFYTAQQVSSMTGMGLDWLWQQAREGRIPHHKLGGRYRFTAEDMEALKAQTAVTPTDAPHDDELIPVGRRRGRL
jgi:excisionase family DNA binding protein